ARRFKFTKKKIGIFVIHAGLVLLILGQFATDMLSKEAAMQLYEGESKNYADAFHENELVLIDTSDPNRDRVYSIPEPLVARQAAHVKKGKPSEIRDAKLPLTVRVRDYWLNCDLLPASALPVAANRGSYKDVSLLPLSESESNPMEKRAAVLVEI